MKCFLVITALTISGLFAANSSLAKEELHANGIIAGLIRGLNIANSPGDCANDIASIKTVILDLERLIDCKEGAMLQIIADSETMFNTFGSNLNCKWSSFLQVFERLNDETVREIFTNMEENLSEFFVVIKGLATCHVNITDCGLQVGRIIRFVFPLDTEAKFTQLSFTHVSDFFGEVFGMAVMSITEHLNDKCTFFGDENKELDMPTASKNSTFQKIANILKFKDRHQEYRPKH